eukprot:212026-Prymnesium_polylepis.1
MASWVRDFGNSSSMRDASGAVAEGSPSTIALQFSGHLRARCVFGPVLLHLRACRERFARCDAFIHTWTTLEPATPHWRRGPRHPRNESSAGCLNRLREAAVALNISTAVLAEQQAAPPPVDSLAPDGTNFSSKDTAQYFYGPEREFGWRMNVHGMSQASRLRRDTERARGARYDIAIRLRPDDVWRFGKPQQVATLWACVASLLPPVGNETVPDGDPSRQFTPSVDEPLAAHKELVSAGHEIRFGSRRAVIARRGSGAVVSLPLFMLALNSCEGRGLTVTASDNCFFGPPSMLDRVLDVFDGRYAAVYAKTTATRLPHSRPELELVAAAKFAGVAFADPCEPRYQRTDGSFAPLRLASRSDHHGTAPVYKLTSS